MRSYTVIVLLVSSVTAWAADPGSAPRLLDARDLPVEVDSVALQKQYDTLLDMSLERIEYSPRGPINLIQGLTGLVLPADATEREKGASADDILPMVKDILLASGSETLSVDRNHVADPSTRALILSQSIEGIPVIGGGVSIGYDASSRTVSTVTAHFVPDRGLPRTPKLSAKQAEQTLAEVLATADKLGAADIEVLEGTHLAYFADDGSSDPPHLVWATQAKLPNGDYKVFYVDAITGIVVGWDRLSWSLTSSVYNLNFQDPTLPSGLPSPLSQAQLNADSTALQAYNHVDIANSRLLQRYSWASSSFPSTVRIGVRWGIVAAHYTLLSSIDYLRFSAATQIYHSFAKPLDIVAHEFAHGIGVRSFPYISTDTEDRQAEALQEAFADFATTVVDVAVNGSPASATWLIGDGIYKADAARAWRSFVNPVSDPLIAIPNLYKDWYANRDMKVEPSLNLTILSHAYYLLIHGGYHARVAAAEIPEINVTALHTTVATAEARAREIFFRAYRDNSMQNGPTFLKLKSAAMAHASTLYGSAAQTSTKNAFEAVGIGLGCTSPPSSAPVVDFENFQCAGRIFTQWPAMPGVNRYIAQITPRGQAWTFATTVTDVSTTSCLLQIPWAADYRIRACSNCGCGPWSATRQLNYWGGTCP